MRVLRLDLFAFGPFTNGKLDFSRKPGALQLIYGPNEAGKSTTLRALLALLYGIPPRTSDAHLHEMTRLRIGATLEDERGRRVSVVRRKGAKQTLLDADGQPLPETVLGELLAGLDEALFRNMFGLDHQRLREGAEALLAGEGELGEGLFDASVGSRALREAKQALRLEADELYKPRGKTPRLNQALDALREKSRKKRDAALSPSAFAEQVNGLSQARQQRDRLLAQRRELLTEQSRLGRMLETLPLLSRYDTVIGDLRSLSARAAGVQLARGAAPELLEEQTRELERRYGVLLSAQAELPAQRTELAALERELETLRARLGKAARITRPLDTPQRTRLRRHWEEQAQHAQRQRELQAQEQAVQEELRACQARSAELGQGAVGAAAEPDLEALVAGVEREDLPAGLLRAQGELTRQAAQLERGLAQLRVELSVEGLARLPLPDQSALAELERAFAEHERSSAEARGRLTQLEDRLGALRLQEAQLLAEGELATLAELERARAAREAALGALLVATHAAGTLGARQQQLEAQHQAAQQRADELADRLRREAVRSYELARLSAECALLERQRGELALLQGSARRGELELALNALLAPAQLAGSSLSAARSKLLKLEQLRDAAVQLVAAQAAHAQLAEHAAQRARTLARALGVAPNCPLAELLGAARARLLRAQAQARDAELLKSRADELGARARALSQQRSACERERALSAEQFAAELAEGGFDAGLAPDELLACLDDMTLAFEAARKLAALRARVEGTEARAEQLLRELAAAVAKHVPAAANLPLAEQLEALSGAQREQREVLRDRQRLEQERERLEAELARLADGRDLSALRQGISQLDPHAVRARLVEIDAACAGLEEEVGALDQEIGRLDAGLARLTEAPYAVAIAEDVEAELVQVRSQLRRYLEVRLSLALLAREVERHRRAHQGPLLARASALFAQLTLGRYAGLTVELDERDEPLLWAVQQTGKQVRLAGLSDGTRDQLYLALRLASIERFLHKSAALPLVLDDAFIHFDDARAQAALLAVGELSKRTQVLFFTHHARMVELAKRALPPAQLALHELDAARGTVAFRDNGPLFAGA